MRPSRVVRIVSRVVRIVSLSTTLLLPGTIVAAADEPLPPVTPFIDSEPGPPSKWTGGAPVAANPATTQPSRWYGGQIIAADLGTLTCVVLTDNPACLIPYLFGGAAIHAAHGRGDRAGLSIALRVLAPGVGALVGGVIGGCTPFSDQPRGSSAFPPCLGEAVVGMVVGLASGLVLDAALASTPPPAAVADSHARAAVRLAPRLSFGQAHLSLGLSATF